MKKTIRIISLIAVIILLVSSIPVSAIIPYETYTYDKNGNKMESPHAFVPYEVVSSKTLGLNIEINEPADIAVEEIVDENGNEDYIIYLADTGNQRVLAISSDYKLIGVINKYINEWGVPDSLLEPEGLYIIDNKLYIADSTGNRILVFSTLPKTDENGVRRYPFEFIKTIPEPTDDVFAEGSIYRPVAVAADKSGRLYVVSETSYQGIIALNQDGSFSSFIGAQSSSISVWDMIWRRFQTAEQRSKQEQNITTEYNNINIDEDGFIYATTNSISENDQMSAILSKSKDGTYAPVKKLNPDGTDIMSRNGFFPPSGEITVNSTETPATKIAGASSIVDIALGDDGVWSIIDEKRQKVYTYDEDGKLLYIFGDHGNQLGNFQNVVALDYMGTNLVILDVTNKNFTVMKRTEYGDLLALAIKNQQDRIYDAAVEDWSNILQRNSNFDMSYYGIGNSLYREGEWEQAMDMFKYSSDTENYSKAFHELRKEFVEKFVVLIVLVIVLAFVLISKVFKFANKVNVAGATDGKKKNVFKEFLYGFHVMFHPFDGFWDLKHEKRGTYKGATVILVLTVLSYMYNAIGRSYIVNPDATGVNVVTQIFTVLLPVFLWIIANWCLTTLFDGEGSLYDIYVATCYALFPLPAFVVITTLLSNVVTASEVSMLNLAMNIAYFWVGLLIFFGMMVIHDYSLFKNVLTTLGTIVGMLFIVFIAALFTSLIWKIISFITNIYLELSYRV